MKYSLQRKKQKGIRYFYFDVADSSHAALLKRARKVDPMSTISKATQIDEY